jgi:hypothetical protein
MMASETSDGSKYGQHDLKTLKVTAWWKKAQDRDSWKAVIKEAKAHKGLWRQIRRRRKRSSFQNVNATF